jgi:hypothetical protein
MGRFVRYHPETVTVHKLKKLFKLVRFQVLTAASMIRIVFWDVLPCKMIVDRRFRCWGPYAPLKRRSTIILHGSTSQKTILNNYLNLTYFVTNCLYFLLHVLGRGKINVYYLVHILVSFSSSRLSVT